MGITLTAELQVLAGICLFFLGLSVGSFLNVCIYRIPLEKSVVSPPSSCPECNTRLTAMDLIPVLSYITLKGRCRYCKAKISARYPLIELLTGLVYLAVYLKVWLISGNAGTSISILHIAGGAVHRSQTYDYSQWPGSARDGRRGIDIYV